MATLPITFRPPIGRVHATAASKSSSGGEEKGLFDWITAKLQKEDQFYETDPILKKVEEKNGVGKKNSVTIPSPKKEGGFGGFGGLFAKK
ncbi:hypothetical protein AMTRI_Chr08g202220 [Amborella trichopoda]|uniref:Thylakoid soluble phosphoprotein TSP9 n=1 Tax=Amborella trichopoda TaxID=13333 RepID=W1PIC5_AMBTC|nr:uncharacterized protein LOC18437874 [Amborella trichopoda]ERN09717.1 hypothetical protein AMTR_s00029p00225070 [Amborella trichopoda]|eukprot:XP_006848136.1 uncharacterized protein LOC18437874 [Amborella trichopoda]